MSGPIVDDPIRVCTACGTVYLEDPILYEDQDICPACGMDVCSGSLNDGSSDDSLFGEYGYSGTVPGISYAEADVAEAGDPTSEITV